MSRETRTYNITDWRKTRCPVECEDASRFGPACSHQRWFPITYIVNIIIIDGNIIKRACKHVKDNVPCSKWDDKNNKCAHTDMVEAYYKGRLEDKDKGRVELKSILRELPNRITCPSCKSTWSITEASITERKRWASKHRKHVKKGGDIPEKLWVCRHPNCLDDKNKPWVFAQGTEERPSDKRHSCPVSNSWRLYTIPKTKGV